MTTKSNMSGSPQVCGCTPRVRSQRRVCRGCKAAQQLWERHRASCFLAGSDFLTSQPEKYTVRWPDLKPSSCPQPERRLFGKRHLKNFAVFTMLIKILVQSVAKLCKPMPFSPGSDHRVCIPQISHNGQVVSHQRDFHYWSRGYLFALNQ